MRPFLLTTLKCTKCNSTKLPKLNPKKINKLPKPEYVPSIDIPSDQQNLILDMVESLSRLDNNLEINEADVFEFFNSEEKVESYHKLEDLFYTIDVVDGDIICVECGVEHNINNGILFLEN